MTTSHRGQESTLTPSPRVSVLDVDAELRNAVPAEHRERARPALVANVVRFEPGVAELDPTVLPASTFALLVASGTLMHEVMLADRELAELVLPGDVVPPWKPTMDALPTDRRFTALSKTHLVALDQRFIRAAATWPELLIAIHRRLNDQEHRVATHGVICQLPRVDQRLLAILWHLAGRIGTVTADGTEIPLRVTHEQLGRLVGAQRPTVSLALRELAERGQRPPPRRRRLGAPGAHGARRRRDRRHPEGAVVSEGRPVVVAYDGSDESERALGAAAELFAGRRLLVVSVWEPGFAAYVTVTDSTGLTPDPSYRLPDPAEAAAIDAAHHDHAGTMAETGAAIARRLGADAQALPVEDADGVAETLVTVAEEHDAAAIAIGARGQGALRSLVFGSTSRRVLHEARCPVLVVGAEQKEHG